MQAHLRDGGVRLYTRTQTNIHGRRLHDRSRKFSVMPTRGLRGLRNLEERSRVPRGGIRKPAGALVWVRPSEVLSCVSVLRAQEGHAVRTRPIPVTVRTRWLTNGVMRCLRATGTGRNQGPFLNLLGGNSDARRSKETMLWKLVSGLEKL